MVNLYVWVLGALILAVLCSLLLRRRAPNMIMLQPLASVASLHDWVASRRFRAPLLLRAPLDEHSLAQWYASLEQSSAAYTPTESREIYALLCRDRFNTAPDRARYADMDALAQWIRRYGLDEFRAHLAHLDDGRPHATSNYVPRAWVRDEPLLGALSQRLSVMDARRCSQPRLWFSSAGYYSALHCDAVNTVSMGLAGVKRWVFIAPQHHADCYPDGERLGNGVQRYAVHNPYAYDTRLYPRMQRVRLLELDQRAGDLLVFPRGWLHFVNTTQHACTLSIVAR